MTLLLFSYKIVDYEQLTGYSHVEQLVACANLFPISSDYAIVATTRRMSNTMRAPTMTISLCVCTCV